MRINNHTDLKAEIVKLEIKSREQEKQLLDRVYSIRESLKPQNLILGGISSLTGIPFSKSDVIQKGALVVVTYILQRFMRKSELKLETTIANFISDLKDKVMNFFNRKKNDNPEESAEDL